MPAGTLNLKGRSLRIEKGATFSLTLTLTQDDAALDLTGYTAAAQMRETLASTDSQAFTVAISSPATGGIITVSLTAVQTAALEYETGFWDLEITSGAVVTRLLEGAVEIKLNVTR